MKPFIVLCTALMASCLGACKTKQVTEQSALRDSLSLWQWDDVVLIHERLDSLEHKPIERTLIFRQQGQALQSIHQQTKQRNEHKVPTPKSKKYSWWLVLAIIFVLAVVFGIYSAKAYLGKMLRLS